MDALEDIQIKLKETNLQVNKSNGIATKRVPLLELWVATVMAMVTKTAATKNQQFTSVAMEAEVEGEFVEDIPGG